MPSSKPPALRTVHLGRIDANDEANLDPELLLGGYLDYRDTVLHISTGHAWFILGPKGAGKSAVFEHIRLKWADDYDRFFVPWDLRGFPVADVTLIQTGQTAGSSRTQSSWEFLLLLRVIQSLSHDEGIEAPGEFVSLVKELVKAGLLPDDWKLSVSNWSSKKASFSLKLGPFGANVESVPVGPLEVAAVLRNAIQSVETSSRHLISLDGLDSFFLETSDEWASLAGLIHAVEATNRFLAGVGLPVSVVAAVRTEAFAALESTDSNKLKSHSVYLDWSPSGVGSDSQLWNLVNTKAKVSQPTLKSFTETYLATSIGQGKFTKMPEYLLAHTRLLPRDLIALLGHLQDAHPGATPVGEGEAVIAVQNYAEQYFVDEVRNNLAGILKNKAGRQQKTSAFFEAVNSVPKAEFTLNDLSRELDGEMSDGETKLLLRQLYEVGAIGIRIRADGQPTRTHFVYRKATPVAFNSKRLFILHDSLVVAWNKPK